MNNIDIVNGLVFQKLEINNETLDNRIISQKKIYLLQELGSNLGYNYNWHLRGPHSPSLTAYTYNNINLLKEYDFSQYSLNGQVTENIDKVTQLSNAAPETLTNSAWHELLASLLYLCRNKESWKIDTKTSLVEKLKKQKPHYTDEQCDSAIQELSSVYEGIVD